MHLVVPALPQTFTLRSLLLWAAVWGAVVLMPQPVRSQDLDFARDCMRVVAEGLMLETSPACVSAFRSQPAARAQFIQTIQETMAQAEAALAEPASPNAAARSLKRLHERASSEAGRWAGGGSPYFGAHP
ncbi:hypothetical protein [Hydrogenophaga sp.]|uniref:hypothetical protein n=1 Tax=Hydrogenophaga sp. TaxID=1904254 RepID=UPI002731819C|nr:hypothetical protein [Hydrogenophaga sp.]MDP2019161.1 hypothetical protein [Hydrogenophaga sp.]MDP3168372.1 hypothetical protein [Hydrogenophaga sp.]MDP3810983.1 hypothetical protein [Hydrogenophaga sp.]